MDMSQVLQGGANGKYHGKRRISAVTDCTISHSHHAIASRSWRAGAARAWQCAAMPRLAACLQRARKKKGPFDADPFPSR
jgi:hypothetical protein